MGKTNESPLSDRSVYLGGVQGVLRSTPRPFYRRRKNFLSFFLYYNFFEFFLWSCVILIPNTLFKITSVKGKLLKKNKEADLWLLPCPARNLIGKEINKGNGIRHSTRVFQKLKSSLFSGNIQESGRLLGLLSEGNLDCFFFLNDGGKGNFLLFLCFNKSNRRPLWDVGERGTFVWILWLQSILKKK